MLNGQTIANFDFETGIPAGWTAESTWKFGNATSLGSEYFTFNGNSTKFAAVNDDKLGATGSGNGKMVTDFIDFTQYPNVFVSFNLYYFHANYDGAGQETFIIYFSEDGTNWKILDAVEEGYGWHKYRNAVSKDIGGKKVKFAFEYKDGNNWSYGVGIDNIKFEVQPDYMVVALPPSKTFGVVTSPEEKVSFEYGFQTYGKAPVNSFKLLYKIDDNAISEIAGQGQLAENGNYTFEIPGFGLGKHILKSTIVINDTFKLVNDSLKLEVHPPVPQFAMADVDNKQMDLHADLKKGKAVLLDFFASWCTPCKNSTPIINKVWEKYGNGKEKFEIYGMTTYQPDNATVIKGLNWGGKYPKFAYSERNELFWSIFNELYGENAIPLFILICPDTTNVSFSQVTWTQIGVPGTLESDLTNAVKACVGSPSMVNHLEVENLSIYPNPVNDIINISFGLNERLDSKIYITDINGKTVKIISETTVNNAVKISSDISELIGGPYFLNISAEKGIKTQKFLKL